MPIPAYAHRASPDRLVKIMCRGSCGVSRYAEASAREWARPDVRSEGGLFAVCLVCGHKATDCRHWEDV